MPSPALSGHVNLVNVRDVFLFNSLSLNVMDTLYAITLWAHAGLWAYRPYANVGQTHVECQTFEKLNNKRQMYGSQAYWVD